MAQPPVPQRMPPLNWRRPTVLWTPVALTAAIGWPAALFYNDAGLQRLVVMAGAAVFALALLTLGVSWAIHRPPRTRRTAVMHVIVAGAISSLAAPFVLTALVSAAGAYSRAGASAQFSLPMAMSMLPLAVVLGLPVALVSAIVFTWIALRRQAPPEPHEVGFYHSDVQPFR